MKHIIFITFTLIAISCSSKKTGDNSSKNRPQEQVKSETVTLPSEELNIVNVFLEMELDSDKYKNNKKSEIILIEKAKKRNTPLEAYEYEYKRRDEYSTAILADKMKHAWILDSTKIKELKLKYKEEKEEEYHWKKTDIKNFEVIIWSFEFYNNYISKGLYLDSPDKLVLIISRPLIIDENTVLLSFESIKNLWPFSPFTHFTVLLKKVNDKWISGPKYFDGIYY